MDYGKVSLEKHAEWKGKIEVNATVPVKSAEDLSLASLQQLFPQGLWTMLRHGFVHQLTHQRLLVNFYLLELLLLNLIFLYYSFF